MSGLSRPLPITRPVLGDEEIEGVASTLRSGWVTQGPMVARFEEAIRERHVVSAALATTSCTAALHLSALALGLGPGDEVVVPAFTWVTSAHCVEYVGARPVFADVCPDTFNLDPEAFEAAITPATRAVVVVHLFGLAAEMDPILRIAARHDLRVVEDAACAIGTTYQGRPVGGLGDAGAFSFHPRKIVTTGEGGAVTTQRQDVAARVRVLRNHGASASPGPPAGGPRPYEMGRFDELGFNLRMSDIQGAVGCAQMTKLDALLEERASAARRYDELLAPVEEVAAPARSPGAGHTYQSYVVRVLRGGLRRRNQIMDALAEDGVQTRPGTHAVHKLGYYRERYGHAEDDFPNARDAEELTITLPLFVGIMPEEQGYVVEQIKKVLTGADRS